MVPGAGRQFRPIMREIADRVAPGLEGRLRWERVACLSLGKKYLVTVEEHSGCGPLLGLLALAAILVVAGVANKGTDFSSPSPGASQPPEEQPNKPLEEQPSQAPTPQPNEPAQLWGAFAVSPTTSKSSWATGYSSESDAIQAAVDSCGQADCKSFSTFNNGYAALAESDRAWYSSSGMHSQAEADQNALSQCEAKDSDANCRIKHSVSF